MKAKHVIFTRNDQSKIQVTPALRALVKKAVRAALEYEKFEGCAEVSVTFTDNENIRALNLEYRSVDRPTDVLSFPTEDDMPSDGENIVLGDIVISLEKAEEQAREYGHSFEREAAFLTVHSTLHLLGYDHETSEKDEADMFDRQKKILEEMGITK